MTATHGTFAGYTRGCRCTDCTGANRDHSRNYGDGPARRWYYDLTKEQRRHCQVCGGAVNIHPIRACWREVR